MTDRTSLVQFLQHTTPMNHEMVNIIAEKFLPVVGVVTAPRAIHIKGLIIDNTNHGQVLHQTQ